jgi:pectinesterase
MRPGSWLGRSPRLDRLAAIALIAGAAGVPSLFAETNLVVSATGDGAFKSVQDAVMAVPSGAASNCVVIRIRPGTYQELVYVQREKRFFRLVGDDPLTTVIRFNLHANLPGADGRPLGTFRTATAVIDADDFIAENVTFENFAGPVGQALALRVDGDRARFRNCRFLGWQDTMLLNRGRQYFTNCYIAGHVDFIFGSATAWFDHCRIECLKDGYITAASTPVDQPFGFVFYKCDIRGKTPEIRTWLGRPWRPHASTLFLRTTMSEVVRPEGWSDWNKPEAHLSARYAEYDSTGPGAAAAARVPWSRQLAAAAAKALTPAVVLSGPDQWDAAGFP